MSMTAVATLVTLLAVAGQTDTTLKVRHGTRLNVSNFGGVIAVQGWARTRSASEATIRARACDVAEDGPNLQVQAMSRRGVPARVDYRSRAGMDALSLSGVYGDISVQGSRVSLGGDGEGRRHNHWGMGYIKATSVEGAVRVRGARGWLELSSVNAEVSLTDAEGEVSIDAVNGDVGCSACGRGGSRWDGERRRHLPGHDRSRGALSLHLAQWRRRGALPDAADATITVATFNGEFESDFRSSCPSPRRASGSASPGQRERDDRARDLRGTTKLRRAKGFKLKEE